MKKQLNYWKHSLLGLAMLLAATMYVYGAAPEREFYEIKIYYLKDKSQEAKVDQFLEKAYLPALHRAGIKKVGIFKPVASDTTAGKRIYVFVPFQSVEQIATLTEALKKDKKYQADGKDYLEAPHTEPLYDRIESVLLQAFSGMTQMHAPTFKTPRNEQIFELRSYEGATEKLYQNKVQMFNEGGEIKIFEDLQFNAVFYGEVLAGSRMPNLMYMTSFENMESRDKHWDAFRDAPAWKKLSGMQEYQNNVSKADIFLLHPATYSDI